MKRKIALVVAILVLCVGVQVNAAGYPDRPIDLIVPWGAGGGADQLGRAIGTALEEELKVSLPVINVPGAIAGIGLAKVKAARPDGYTICVITADSTGADSQGKLAVHLDEFTFLSRLMLAPSFFFSNYRGSIKTFQDLIDQAKKNPGEIKIAITGAGSADALTVKYLSDNGIKITTVPYPKPGERYASVLGKHNDLLYEQSGDVSQFILAKQLRPLVIFHPKRVDAFPDVPSIKEFGMDIYLPQYRGLLTNKGVPQDRIEKLAQAIKAAYNKPPYQKFLKKMYCEPDSYMGPKEYTDFVKEDFEAYKELWK